MQARCSLAGNLYNDFHLLLFGGSWDRETGLSRLSPWTASCAPPPLPRVPRVLPLHSTFATGIAKGVSRGISQKRNRSRQGGGASGGRLRLAPPRSRPRSPSRFLYLGGGIAPPPFHSPSRWPLLVPSVESGGLRESLETTWCLADPRPLTSNSLTLATLPLLLPPFQDAIQVRDATCPRDSDGGVSSSLRESDFFGCRYFFVFLDSIEFGDDAWFSIIFQEEKGYFSYIRDHFAYRWAAGYGFEVLLGAALNLYGEVERKHDREINLFVMFPMKTFSTVGGTWHEPWPWRIARSPSSKGTKV